MEINNDKTIPITEATPASHPNTDTSIFRKNRSIMYLVAIFGIILDQISKIWVTNNLPFYRPVNIFGTYLRLILVHNSGLIWGIPLKTVLTYYVLPVIGIIFIFIIAYKNRSVLKSVAYGLIIAGAVGNLIDRFRLGYVIDFIDMGIKSSRWATYNIADASIVIGITIVLASEIFKKKPVTNA
jgi:signal peptidase II